MNTEPVVVRWIVRGKRDGMEDVYSSKPWLKNYDKHVPQKVQYEDKTFAERFHEVADRYQNKPALIYMGKELTFSDIDLLSNKVAAFLIESSLEPGDVVGLHMPNLLAHYISIVGAQKAGCVSTGLSPLLTPRELENQLNDCGAKLIMTVDLLFEKIAEVADKASFSNVVVTGAADFLPGPKQIPASEVKPLPGKKVTSFMDAVKDMPDSRVQVKRNMDDTMFLMYTGGTTGPPKGTLITQRNFMYNRLQWIAYMDLKADLIGLSAFPLFHIGGVAFLGTYMLTGITQICVPNPRDYNFFIEVMKAYKPNFTANVPTVYFELMKSDEFRGLDFSNLQFCISGAAPFPPEYIEELESITGKNTFIETYGMTEVAGVCSNPRYGKKKPFSIGMPFPDTEFKIVDPETGQPAALGEPGELAVRGPQVTKGYHNRPEETTNAIRDGWFYTGDVAKMDEDGYFYIVDRVKDMVNVSGFKVFTRELDDVLVKHPDIELAATLGVPDPKRPGSERVVAAIMLKPGVEANDAEKQKILDYLRENVAPYCVPKVIEFMNEMPKSGVGKVLKRELKVMMIDHELE
jgi:acyl-CoA synthetase (AMP-forming)/AMP-acid ligase II